jgi:biotin carboxylase
VSTVLVVGAGTFQLPAIETATRLGHRVVAVDGDPAAAGLALADVGLHHDIRDIAGCVELARREQIDGVLTVASEAAIPTVAGIAEALGLRGPSPEAAIAATDKAVMRARFAAAGVHSAVSIPCATLDEAVAAVGRVGMPAVLKPADSAGARGVSMVRTGDEVVARYADAHHWSRSGVVLVEEFIAGPEISVEMLVSGGRVSVLALSEKVRTPPPWFVDTMTTFPAVLPASTATAAVEVARAGVVAVEVDDAAVHAELIVTEGGPVIVELAARGAGVHIFTKMLPWVTGIDVVGCLVDMALGNDVVVEPERLRASTLVFPSAPQGILRAVRGLDEARAVEGVSDIALYLAPGDRIAELRSGVDRLGHVIANGDDRDEATARARLAESLLDFDVDQS